VKGALRILEHHLAVYRRTWRGTVLVSFLSPLLFLASMGIGLGGLVNRNSGGIGGVSYLRFLAPGLLAATAMQTAAFETMYPIMGRLRWDKTYDGMLATPLRIRDLVGGEVLWLAGRLLTSAALFTTVMALFGVLRSPEALLAVPAAAATGLAFGAPIIGFSATRENDSGFAGLTRFVILPLFLLSGPFFPIEQLPRLLQAVAWAGPLAHGVALTRGLVLGTLDGGGALIHTAVLAAYTTAGILGARWALTRKLVT
jgi:lipooligosaccharide transport system permease protein